MEDINLHKIIKEEFELANPDQIVHDVRLDEYKDEILILHKKKDEHNLRYSTLSSSKAAAWARNKRIKRLGL